jgi:hypothetical protein
MNIRKRAPRSLRFFLQGAGVCTITDLSLRRALRSRASAVLFIGRDFYPNQRLYLEPPTGPGMPGLSLTRVPELRDIAEGWQEDV